MPVFVNPSCLSCPPGWHSGGPGWVDTAHGTVAYLMDNFSNFCARGALCSGVRLRPAKVGAFGGRVQQPAPSDARERYGEHPDGPTAGWATGTSAFRLRRSISGGPALQGLLTAV
jgi:hypothetical protein